ncbi:MAG: ABC transporter permease [Anaerolineae bacterium]
MRTLRLIVRYVRHNLMSQMAYRGAFFLQVLGMALNDMMLLIFWALLFRQFPTLNGWTLQGIITLYAVVATGFGVAAVIFGNSSRISRTITTGDLDYYLALPADPLVHLLVSRMVLSGLGDALFGVILFIIFVPGWLWKLPLFVLTSALTAILFVSFAVITGSLAFWLGQSEYLAMQLRNAMLSFSLYPVDIFPDAIRMLLYTLIPAALVGSVPATLLMAFDVRQLLLLVAATAAMALLARVVFHRGLRRYESGNLVTVRG